MAQHKYQLLWHKVELRFHFSCVDIHLIQEFVGNSSSVTLSCTELCQIGRITGIEIRGCIAGVCSLLPRVGSADQTQVIRFDGK